MSIQIRQVGQVGQGILPGSAHPDPTNQPDQAHPRYQAYHPYQPYP